MNALHIVENALLVAFVVTVMVTDWRWRRIPNLVTYPAMVAGLALGAMEGLGAPFQSGFLDHLTGLALAFIVSYPFYAGGGMKAGDAKLLMSVGALRGALFLLPAAFYGALIGGVVALIFLVARRLAPVRPGEGPRTMRGLLHTWIPYGVALGAGALVALLVELTAP
ncbi:MAG: prepilin peptidase [Chloroflexi bacterium]|nr:prepilin peptidase [Chloroflexota bacterium]